MTVTSTSQRSKWKIHFGRQPSWVVHNELRDDRTRIEDAILSFLRRPPSAYQLGTPVFLRSPAADVLFAALEEPTSKAEDGLVVVFAVHAPLDANVAAAGERPNCHWMTEIWPSRNISFIPVTYEFARGARPAKRLNFIVNGDGGSYRRLGAEESIVTGFRHFVSAAYSRNGLAQLDFHLTVRHRPPPTAQVLPEWAFAPTRLGFVNMLKRDLTIPLAEIENELYADRGVEAPSEIREIDSLFAKILAQLTDTAYSNLDLFKQEWESNINPSLHAQGIGAEIVVPADEPSSGAVDISVGRVLARHPDAMTLLLALADRRTAGPPPVLPLKDVPLQRQEEAVAALANVGLVAVDIAGVRATARGEMVVQKLRAKFGASVAVNE